jgi:hypothetical protein
MDLALQWGQDDMTRMLIDPTHCVVHDNKGGLSSIMSDVEGYHHQQFERAYEEGNGLEQIFHLEKLVDLFLGKRQHIHCAHLLNAAYIIAKESHKTHASADHQPTGENRRDVSV